VPHGQHRPQKREGSNRANPPRRLYTTNRIGIQIAEREKIAKNRFLSFFLMGIGFSQHSFTYLLSKNNYTILFMILNDRRYPSTCKIELRTNSTDPPHQN
jgi:hypothetical protein